METYTQWLRREQRRRLIWQLAWTVGVTVAGVGILVAVLG